LKKFLFLIFIKDLAFILALACNLFADDTTQLASNKNLVTLTEFVNAEFKKTVQFFIDHRLSLHPNKTKFMLISPSKTNFTPEIYIDFNYPNGP
jgi:hypothetical protein